MTLLELDWCFYTATGAGTRKAREMTTHTKAAALVMFQGVGFSGYLRISGTAEPLKDPADKETNRRCRFL